MADDSAATPESGGHRAAAKPYSRPALVVYGSIAKLTQSGDGSGVDGGLDPTMQMMCL